MDSLENWLFLFSLRAEVPLKINQDRLHLKPVALDIKPAKKLMALPRIPDAIGGAKILDER